MSKALDVSAFPIPHDDRPGAYMAEPGMTLRDYFAATALNGMRAKGAGGWFDSTAGGTLGEQICQQAYEWADCMLKERAK